MTPELLFFAALAAALGFWLWWRRAHVGRRLAPIANAEAVRLEELLEASPVPACITEGGELRFLNRAMGELSGTKPGAPFGELFRPGPDRARATAAGRGTPCPPDAVLQLERPDGTTREVTIRTVPAHGRGEEVFLQWLFDRTEHRRAEQAAVEAQARHQSIMQGMADSIIVIDERGRIESFSPSAEKTFGYHAEELVGKNISILMPPPDRERHDGYLREYVETGWASGARERSLLTSNAQIVRPERETVAVRKDGTRFPIRLMVSEVDTGSERFFVGLLSDLTERKRLERELADRAAFQEALLQSIPYPMFVIDAAGCFVSCNTPHTEMFGMSSAALRGKTIRDLEYLLPGTREELLREAEAVIREGGRYSREFDVTDVRGGKHVAILSADGFRTSAGTPGGLIGLMVDITDQKRIAEELQIARDRAEEARAIIETQKRRMQDELDVGRHIQMSMVPTRFPPLAGADLWGTLRPAREVGGDFYDFFLPSEEELWLCIGDVSGKGVPAALLMAVTKTLIKSLATQDRNPGEIFTRVNQELSRDNDNSMFVTAFLARLDLASGELCYTNAGHNPPLIRRAGGSIERLATRHGAVLGAAEEVRYGASSARLAAGDTLLLYTDGVSEAQDTGEQLFTEARLQEVLKGASNGSARNLASAVVQAVDRFAGAAEQADDITLLALRYGAHAGPPPLDHHMLQIPNELAAIPAALEQVERLVSDCGGNGAIQQRFAQAFDEVLSNIIKYAYPVPAAHLIECDIRREGDAIIAVVRDDGVPFNPLHQPPPDTTAPLEDREVGGLGIHLVRKLFDGVDYRRADGRNVLTLSKSSPLPRPEAR